MKKTIQTFKVELENGQIDTANLISLPTIDNQKYAIYTINNKNGSIDILASYVEKDSEGYDILKDITSNQDQLKISNYIKNIISDK